MKWLTSGGPDSSQGYPRDPIMSPDGRSIAAMMLSSRPGGWDRTELRVFPATGAAPGRRVAEWKGPIPYARVLAFSPAQDAVWVWVMRSDDTADIALVNIADGRIRVLKQFSDRQHTQPPSLSPDGRFVTFNDADNAEAPQDVFIMPTDGGPAVRLEHPARDWLPVFTPDGSGIAFVSNRDGQSDVWFQPVTNGRPVGEPRKVWANAAPYGVSESFGQNGSLFYYFALNGLEIYTANVDLDHHSVGTPEHVVPRPGDINGAPQFSPDGQFLAHLRDHYHRLVLRRLATGEEREYPLPTWAYAQTIDFCPDGRTLVIGALKQMRPFVLHVDLDRGSIQDIELSQRPPQQPRRPVCVGDGVIFTRAGTKDTNDIIRRSFDAGKETTLYRGVTEGALYRSLKGDQFAFTVRTDSERIFVMPATGGRPKFVASSPLLRYGQNTFSDVQGLMWMPDGRSLLLARSPLPSGPKPVESPEVTLWRVPIDGAPPSEAARMRLPAYPGGIWGAFDYALHPSGNRITYLRSSGFIAQEWAIDNLLQFIQSGRSVVVPQQP